MIKRVVKGDSVRSSLWPKFGTVAIFFCVARRFLLEMCHLFNSQWYT